MDLASEQLIALIPLLPLAGAIVNGLFGHRLPKAFVGLLACGTVLGAFVIAATAAYELSQAAADQVIATNLYRWFEVGGISSDVRFVIDRLSAVMSLVVTGVGFLIHVYSVGY